MSSLDYMRGDKTILQERRRSMTYNNIEELKRGAEVNSKASRDSWKIFKESLKDEV